MKSCTVASSEATAFIGANITQGAVCSYASVP
jgi:hypothetical protein